VVVTFETVDLRRAVAADEGFCYQVHRAAMREYVDAVWGWDEAVQRAFHQRGFQPQNTQIIIVDGADAGVVVLEQGPEAVNLARIAVDPTWQGRGVGTTVVSALMDEAAASGRRVELEVFEINDRARALYERLGFREVGRHGPNGMKVLMSTGNPA
jgi:ribosomal protein S18 acetylase RimI-like enzyme